MGFDSINRVRGVVATKGIAVLARHNALREADRVKLAEKETHTSDTAPVPPVL